MPVTTRQVVVVPIPPAWLARSVFTSLLKCDFMGDTFVRNRRTIEKYERSVMGDVAKLAVKWWLESRGCSVTDWDDVRTSWRSQIKTFDLQVNGHNIEVRSSVASVGAIREVLRREHIIHPCGVRVKELNVQVFFPDATCTVAWLCGWARQADLDQPALRSPRRIGPRLVDFLLMPFGHRNASPMARLPGALT
jgi:hypothetical protein